MMSTLRKAIDDFRAVMRLQWKEQSTFGNLVAMGMFFIYTIGALWLAYPLMLHKASQSGPRAVITALYLCVGTPAIILIAAGVSSKIDRYKKSILKKN